MHYRLSALVVSFAFCMLSGCSDSSPGADAALAFDQLDRADLIGDGSPESDGGPAIFDHGIAADQSVSPPPAAPSTAWVSQLGLGYAKLLSLGTALAVDDQGNSYIAGYFADKLVAGGATHLGEPSKATLFVAKLDAAGAVSWVRLIGEQRLSEDAMVDLAVDGSGQVWMVGQFDGSATFGAETLQSSGGRDGFVARLDAAGQLSWVHALRSPGHDRLIGVAVDGAGDGYVVGTVATPTSLEGVPLTPVYAHDLVVAKLSSAGKVVWAQMAAGSSKASDATYDIAVSSAGEAVVAGAYRGTWVFGSHQLSTQNSRELFVAHLDLAGSWRSALGTQSAAGSSAEAFAVAVDGKGAAYVAGGFKGSTSLGGSLSLKATAHELLVAKIDKTGQVGWLQTSSGVGSVAGHDVSVDGAGRVFVTGWFSGVATIAGQKLQAQGGADAFVLMLDDNDFRWIVGGGGVEDDFGVAVIVAPDGSLRAVGRCEGSATFGGVTLTPKLSQSVGLYIWAMKP
jgi:hypothetical protein